MNDSFKGVFNYLRMTYENFQNKIGSEIVVAAVHNPVLFSCK